MDRRHPGHAAMNDERHDEYEPEIATIGPERLELRVFGEDEPRVQVATAAPPWVRPRHTPAVLARVLPLRLR
jgi:hypothetical protein